ncbi:MAG: class I SAM-dependent methyltransferase [Acetobacteraceae bacterium]
MVRRLPPYFDSLLAAYRAGHAGRHVHLGFWDNPPPLGLPVMPAAFEAAQARLTARMLQAAALQPGRRVLDVGCGLGGLLAAVNDTCADMSLTGVNIDPRQLAICGTIAPRSGNHLSLVEADACALPFPAGRFDTVFCIEAMFHFRARRLFLAEAARVLRQGGVLLLTDILMRPPPAAPWPDAHIAAVIRRDYGPWPEIWAERCAVVGDAADWGLDVVGDQDWSAATLPSYGIIAPDPMPERQAHPNAGAVFRWLHANGWLSYRMLAFRRR